MSGARKSMAGAAAFQIGIRLSVAPPLSYADARGGLSGSRSAALTYNGYGLTALPAAATCPMHRATDHAWKYSSASLPKTSCQVPCSRTALLSALSTSGLSSSAGTFCSRKWVALLLLAALITTLAAVYPAHRAASVDPITSLRHE